MQELNTPKTL